MNYFYASCSYDTAVEACTALLWDYLSASGSEPLSAVRRYLLSGDAASILDDVSNTYTYPTNCDGDDLAAALSRLQDDAYHCAGEFAAL